jgi:hypothetical protein
MTIDKSLRQNYQIGKKVNSFKEQFKNIARKSFAPEETTKEQKTLGSMVKSQAKSAVQKQIQKVVLNKLGLSFLNPYLGIASLFGYNPFDLMQGYTTELMPGQTQAQYEAARAARQKQARIDNMLARRGAGKDYSQQNLNELTMGSRPGFYGNVPTYDLGMYQGIKNIIPKTPTVITPHEPDEVVSDITKDFSFEDKKGGPKGDIDVTKDFSFEDAKAKAAKDAADKAAADRAAAKSRQAALEAMRGGVGRNGDGGFGDSGAPGRGGHHGRFNRGGYVDRPLPGGNKYL